MDPPRRSTPAARGTAGRTAEGIPRRGPAGAGSVLARVRQTGSGELLRLSRLVRAPGVRMLIRIWRPGTPDRVRDVITTWSYWRDHYGRPWCIRGGRFPVSSTRPPSRSTRIIHEFRLGGGTARNRAIIPTAPVLPRRVNLLVPGIHAVSVALVVLAVIAPGPIGAQESDRPAFRKLRYEEDWSVLRDPARRTESLDRLKFIPLTTDSWAWLSLGSDEPHLPRLEARRGQHVDNGRSPSTGCDGDTRPPRPSDDGSLPTHVG